MNVERTDDEPNRTFVTHPEAFAKANAEARDAHLVSLTRESAAQEFEAIMAAETELEAARIELGLPPLPPPPLPKSIAILLNGGPLE